MDVPQHIQDKLAQYQNLQNQIQMISIQKQQLMLAKTDLENAKKELETVAEGRIYRMVGPLLIETGKEACQKFVKEEQDTADAKINILEKQEKKIVEKMNDMRAELQSALAPPKAG